MPVNKYKSGMRGQKEAEIFLENSGYKILHSNYRTRNGEIDIICSFGNVIIFVEVKFRSGTAFGLPRESVGLAKQKKIISTAMHFISVKNLSNSDFRFDVIEVLENNNHMNINHIENAFWA
ncbi:MAG: YraN family protein [Defluviitaleaceae bacterium]|nr:YraN family protein [Defluviitaleaceae bacterium]